MLIKPELNSQHHTWDHGNLLKQHNGEPCIGEQRACGAANLSTLGETSLVNLFSVMSPCSYGCSLSRQTGWFKSMKGFRNWPRINTKLIDSLCRDMGVKRESAIQNQSQHWTWPESCSVPQLHPAGRAARLTKLHKEHPSSSEVTLQLKTGAAVCSWRDQTQDARRDMRRGTGAEWVCRKITTGCVFIWGWNNPGNTIIPQPPAPAFICFVLGFVGEWEYSQLSQWAAQLGDVSPGRQRGCVTLREAVITRPPPQLLWFERAKLLETSLRSKGSPWSNRSLWQQRAACNN